MYCPQCGQQQVSDVIRYCSRCGFLLDGVNAVVARGRDPADPIRSARAIQQLSPRDKGVRQGALMMLQHASARPAGVRLSRCRNPGSSRVIVGITAITLVLGGLLRIFYALLMEETGGPCKFGVDKWICAARHASIRQTRAEFCVAPRVGGRDACVAITAEYR